MAGTQNKDAINNETIKKKKTRKFKVILGLLTLKL